MTDTLREYLLDVLTQLRQEFARRLKEQRRDFPNMRMPCETCAFRTSTDGEKGFEATVINFVSAMQQGEPFYCHHNFKIRRGRYEMPRKHLHGKLVVDWSKVNLCTAWSVLASLPEPLQIADYVPENIRTACVEIARADPTSVLRGR